MWPFKRKLYDEKCGICACSIKVGKWSDVEGGGGRAYSRIGKGDAYICGKHKKSEILKYMKKKDLDTYFRGGFIFTTHGTW